MELRRYALLIWSWLWLIVLGTAIAATSAYVTSSRSAPVYQASTRMIISQSKAAVIDSALSLPSTDRLARTYAEMLRSEPVLEETSRRLGLPVSADAVSVEPVNNTQLLLLSVEDANPQSAAAIANEIPKVFVQQNDDLQSRRFADSKASLQRQMAGTQANITELQANIEAGKAAANPDKAELDRLQRDLSSLQVSYASLSQSFEGLRLEEAKQLDTLLVIEQARPARSPIGPKTIQNTLLGAALGAMLALGVAFLVEYLDDTVKSPDDVGKLLGLTTLGIVPAFTQKQAEMGLVVLDSAKSAATESYRILRTNLQFAGVDHPICSLLITSASPTEGKSLTVANLGAALAQAGQRTIIVDGDLHRPRQHRIFGLPNNTGVTSALLRSNLDLTDIVQETSVPGLRVLTSGPLPPNPAELLGSAQMRNLLALLAAEADSIIVDSPPCTALSDAAILSTRVDGVLLVLNAASTRSVAAKRAIESLAKVKARLLGAVLNRVPMGGSGYYYYYHSYNHDDNAGGGVSRRRKLSPWRLLTRRTSTRRAQATVSQAPQLPLWLLSQSH